MLHCTAQINSVTPKQGLKCAISVIDLLRVNQRMLFYIPIHHLWSITRQQRVLRADMSSRLFVDLRSTLCSSLKRPDPWKREAITSICQPKPNMTTLTFEETEMARGCWSSAISQDLTVISRQLAPTAVITLSVLDRSTNTSAACLRGLCSWSISKRSTGEVVGLKVERSSTNKSVGRYLVTPVELSCSPGCFWWVQVSNSVSEKNNLKWFGNVVKNCTIFIFECQQFTQES